MLCSECKKSGHNIRTCPLRQECPICFDIFTDNNVSITKCAHKFCTTCLLKSANRNGECPICRTKLCENIVIRTFEDSKERIIKKSLDDFGIVDRFPDMMEDDEFRTKIVEDFVYFSHLILYHSMEELNK
jgi:hypothetical protein